MSEAPTGRDWHEVRADGRGQPIPPAPDERTRRDDQRVTSPRRGGAGSCGRCHVRTWRSVPTCRSRRSDRGSQKGVGGDGQVRPRINFQSGKLWQTEVALNIQEEVTAEAELRSRGTAPSACPEGFASSADGKRRVLVVSWGRASEAMKRAASGRPRKGRRRFGHWALVAGGERRRQHAAKERRVSCELRRRAGSARARREMLDQVRAVPAG